MVFRPDKKTCYSLNQFSKLIDIIDNKPFFVVMGGIAVDGYAGKLTRNHSDVDMLVFREDLEKAEQVLTKLDYKHRRFSHPKKPNLEYKMQTGDKDHLFSFQILDKVGRNKFEISFYRDPHLVFPLSYIKPPVWLNLGGATFPAVKKEFLIKLKENEVKFFKQLKKNYPEEYLSKRRQRHLNTLRDLELLKN